VASRAAIVTGASAGIGLAVSELLARTGFAVTMLGRNSERIEAAARSLAAAAGEVTPVSGDAGDEATLAALVETHLERNGRLDLVVANAGFGSGGAAGATEPRHLERTWRLNVAAPFALARLALPALRNAGRDHGAAWFVVTASISGVRPTAGFAAYSASKAAALSLARSVNAEEASNGVRACALCPAFVDTAMTEWTRDRIPAEAMLRAGDVAAALQFLLQLSPTASVTEIVIGRTGAGPYTP
jgi:NAD(P)-dependent dehydrogenase (short-subunit alcohol dehydrogenase family)